MYPNYTAQQAAVVTGPQGNSAVVTGMQADPVYRSAPASRSDFRGSCAVDPPQGSIAVPKVRYILHRLPYIVEKVTQETEYSDIPIAVSYESRTYQPTTERACRSEPAPCAAPKRPCA